MSLKEIINSISTQGLSVVLVLLFCYAAYHGVISIWSYYKEEKNKDRITNEKLMDHNDRLLLQMEKNNIIMRETTETNKLLANKLTLELKEVKSDVQMINVKLDHLIK